MKITIFILIVMTCVTCRPVRSVLSQNDIDTYAKISELHAAQVLSNSGIQFHQGGEVIQIVFIRHGEPSLDKKSARSRKKMKQYVYDYDTAHVYPFTKSPVYFKKGQIDTIYASPIVRASDTAHKLFKDQFIILEDSMFREFEREVFPLPLLKLRPKTWGVLSRIPWILGLQSKNIEGFRQAKKRTKSNALFLESKATQSGRVVLVAHGFLNRYLEKYLQEQDWQLSYNGGKDYLSVKVLSKIMK